MPPQPARTQTAPSLSTCDHADGHLLLGHPVAVLIVASTVRVTGVSFQVACAYSEMAIVWQYADIVLLYPHSALTVPNSDINYLRRKGLPVL